MKKIILVLVMVSLGVSVTAQNEVKIDTSKSVVKWTGANLFKFNKHYGTVKFKSGEFIFKNDSIIGGQFEIDMNTIMNSDGKFNEMLVAHLKDEDFFNVSAYPTSKLEILSFKYKDATQFNVEANLTIKGVTQKINYRSTFENTDDGIIMKSSFIIDRTRWGVNYESKSFIDGLKDGAISDAIEFEVIVSSTKTEIHQ